MFDSCIVDFGFFFLECCDESLEFFDVKCFEFICEEFVFRVGDLDFFKFFVIFEEEVEVLVGNVYVCVIFYCVVFFDRYFVIIEGVFVNFVFDLVGSVGYEDGVGINWGRLYCVSNNEMYLEENIFIILVFGFWRVGKNKEWIKDGFVNCIFW